MIYPATVMLAMLTDNQAFHTAAQGYLQKWLCRCSLPAHLLLLAPPVHLLRKMQLLPSSDACPRLMLIACSGNACDILTGISGRGLTEGCACAALETRSATRRRAAHTIALIPHWVRP